MTVLTIHPAELAAGAAEPLDLLDVRTVPEFVELHALDSRCVPLHRLDPAEAWADRRHPQRPLHLLCRSGTRARVAAERFIAAGFRDVVVVDGGTEAWAAAGLPVVRGRRAISLERQVRIGAGTLVATGAALAWFVHPAWIALSGAVGLGLVFAGVTGICAMGLLLARMPWNRGQAADCAV